MLFISHDLPSLEKLCDRVVLMAHGRLVAAGAPHDVVLGMRAIDRKLARPRGGRHRSPPGKCCVQISGISFHDDAGRTGLFAHTGEPLVTRVAFDASESIPDAVLEVFYYSRRSDPPLSAKVRQSREASCRSPRPRVGGVRDAGGVAASNPTRRRQHYRARIGFHARLVLRQDAALRRAREICTRTSTPLTSGASSAMKTVTLATCTYSRAGLAAPFLSGLPMERACRAHR